MARKSPNVNHAVNAVFYINGKELAEQLAVFCGLKKLAWSPDVKVAMVKRPATILADDAFFKLREQPVQALQDILVSLLKPIKEHDLFDLSDWLRDLDGVPAYLQAHWTSNRVPKPLDDLVKQALKAEDSGGLSINGNWPMPPSREEQGTDEEEDLENVGTMDPAKIAKLEKKVKPQKRITGPKGRGKASKVDVKVDKALKKPETPSVGEVISEASAALADKQMNKVHPRIVWGRFHKAVETLLVQNGMELRGPHRPSRLPTDDAKQALISYQIKASSSAPDWHMFKESLLESFADQVLEVEAINDEEPPTSFKVWVQHA